MKVYDAKLRVEARRELERNSRFSIGKKDGLIVIEVDDESPQRAADIGNQYVEELRRMTSVLAVSEAQQRRVFFEEQMKTAQDQLVTRTAGAAGQRLQPGCAARRTPGCRR